MQAVEVTWTDGDGRSRTARFTRSFRIGRDPGCDVVLPGTMVSREHLEVRLDANGWSLRDLGSRNGTYLAGRRIAAAPLAAATRVQLGSKGPAVGLRVVGEDSAIDRPPPREQAGLSPAASDAGTAAERSAPPPTGRDQSQGQDKEGQEKAGEEPARAIFRKRTEKLSRDAIAERYFGEEEESDIGDHTRMVRAVYREQKRRQKRTWLYVLGVLSTALCVALAALVWQWTRIEQTRQLAIDLFYSMKELQLDLARLESAVRATGEDRLLQQLRANRQRIQAMRERYQEYIRDAELIDPDLEPVDRLILQITRVFGECELTMPPAFVEEIKAYIAKWQATDRLARAVDRIRARDQVALVARAMRQNGLPPQFFYLGLQESNFNPQAVGPTTRFGIAKGAWQFIPATAQDYGLRVGPLAGQRVYDPDDERFDFEAATWAAARFLSDIYNTDAQASGLLVMASYNWGPGNIIQRIRAMPENPRERNFWALLQLHNIPQETYDYVFSIVSAAVIGENPRLFGFDFDNPLLEYK